ncbi:MAG: hypothetical protein MJ198_04830 [Bacteroidales bacterium]|nr:hypothetical protein [Bacteroidales bacterium]
MKKFSLILLILMFALGASAQSWGSQGWQLGAFGGATSFAGDIMNTKTSDHSRFVDTRYDFGIALEKKIISGIDVRLVGSYGGLYGYKEKDAIGEFMNHKFESKFFDYHFDLKLDVLKFALGENFPFSAYGLIGIGGMSYSSNWSRDNVMIHDTSGVALIYPVGLGAAAEVGPFNIFVEGVWNVSFSDALDAQVTNNTDHWIQDSYLTFSVGATYEFGGSSSGHYAGASKSKSGATKKAQKHRNVSSKNLHKSTSSYRKRATSSKHHYNNGGRAHVKSQHTNSLSTKRKYTTSSGKGSGLNIKKSDNTNSSKNNPKYPVHY